MYSLNFSVATCEDFSQSLGRLWQTSSGPTLIHGTGPLAEAIGELARAHGRAHQQIDQLESSTLPPDSLLVLTESQETRLAEQLISLVDAPPIQVLAPITSGYFEHRPLFLITIPKSGTHLLYELATALGYQAGVEPPLHPQGGYWYCVEYSNSHTVARDFFVDSVRRAPYGNRLHAFTRSPALFIYRHPLDILLSEAHYYHREGKTTFAGWLNQLDFNERVERLAHPNWLLGSLRDRIGGFLPWVEFPNVIPLSFEELVGEAGGGSQEDQQRLIWSIQLKLQAPGHTAEIANHLFNRNSATFREGRIGGYTTQLAPEIIAEFLAQNQDILAYLGYPSDGTMALPETRAARRRRPLRYSAVNPNELPATLIEPDFLGCNLVTFRQRLYAIPENAGPVAFDQLTPDQLAALPASTNLSDLKLQLVLGTAGLAQRRHDIDALGNALRDNRPLPSNWHDETAPRIVREYLGFNIIGYRGLYFGLRQSLGPVDLTLDVTELSSRYPASDLIVERTPRGVCRRIDALASPDTAASTSREALADIAEQLNTLQSSLLSMEQFQGRLEHRLHGVAQALDHERGHRTVLAEDLSKVSDGHEQLSTEHQQAITRLGHMAREIDQLGALQQKYEALQNRLEELNSLWAIRVIRRVARLFGNQ